MSGEGAAAFAITGPWVFDAGENSHRHGRWTGLFKLGEECGELTVAAIDLLFADETTQPSLRRSLEDEIADVAAACVHAAQANGLDAARIAARELRRARSIEAGVEACLMVAARHCGAMGKLLGKIGAFPFDTEHPDCAGNLPGRLEIAIADVLAAAGVAIDTYALDVATITARVESKIALFREWFPAPASECAA